MLVYSPEREQPLATLATQTRDVLSLAFSPDGQLLVAGCGNRSDWFERGSLRFWDVQKRSEVRAVETGGAVRALSFAPNQSRLALGGFDWNAFVMDVGDWKNAAGSISARYQLVQGRPRALAMLTDDSIACVADINDLVIGHLSPIPAKPDATPIPPPRYLQGHRGPLLCLSVSTDTQTLVTGSADGTIRVWKRPE